MGAGSASLVLLITLFFVGRSIGWWFKPIIWSPNRVGVKHKDRTRPDTIVETLMKDLKLSYSEMMEQGLKREQLTSERLQKLLDSHWTLDHAFLLTILAEDLPVHIAKMTPLYYPKENLVGPKLLMELANDEDNSQRKLLVNRMKQEDFSKMVETTS